MAVAGGPDIVESGLVLCLDAGNPKSYSGTGTAWTNLISSGGNATLINSPTYSSTNGGAIVFDGTNDYVSETSLLTNGFWQGNWTASFWVNFDTIDATSCCNDKTLLQHGTAYPSNGLHLSQRNTKIYFGLYGNDLGGTISLSIGRWYNIVFALNNSTYLKQIYLNSFLDNFGIGGGSYTGTGGNTRIAGIVLGFGSYFDGFMGSCSFYNRVLTAAEVEQNFNALRPRFGI